MMFLARHAVLIGKVTAVLMFAGAAFGLVGNELRPHWLSVAGAWYCLIGGAACIFVVDWLEKMGGE